MGVQVRAPWGHVNEPSGVAPGTVVAERSGLISPVSSSMAQRMTRCPEGQRSLLGVGVGMGGKRTGQWGLEVRAPGVGRLAALGASVFGG